MKAARVTAIVLSLACAAVGLWRGTWAVGGSDSSCYALMSASFARGEWQPSSDLALSAPWTNAAHTFAPAGFIPSATRLDAASPVCAPGFSLLLAPFYAVGGPAAIFLVTPIAGAWLVYLTFSLAQQVAGPIAALASAFIVATMPVFVFQVVQPMNDVTVAALWLGVLVLASRPADHSAAMGALTGLAVLIRPNLAPVAVCVAVWCAGGGRRRVIAFALASAPFAVVLLAFNLVLYGHPLRTGYGDLDTLFRVTHIAANVENYGRALLVTQLGFPLLGLFAAVWAPKPLRGLIWFLTAAALTVIAIYLLYRPLPEWWYLRFMLPALPVLVVLAVAAVTFGSRRPTLAIPVAIIAVAYASTSQPMREALSLAQLERRFRLAGAVARDQLPQNSVFITVWESGTVRFHAAREALVWDSLDPGDLDRAVHWLRAHGREPFIMIEDWEEPLFRSRFAERSRTGQLDWPPRFEIDRRVKIFSPGDRERFLAGDRIATEYVRPDRR